MASCWCPASSMLSLLSCSSIPNRNSFHRRLLSRYLPSSRSIKSSSSSSHSSSDPPQILQFTFLHGRFLVNFSSFSSDLSSPSVLPYTSPAADEFRLQVASLKCSSALGIVFIYLWWGFTLLILLQFWRWDAYIGWCLPLKCLYFEDSLITLLISCLELSPSVYIHWILQLIF